RGRISNAVLREAFKEQIGALAEGGVDLIILETFGSLNELTEAINASKEVAPDLPIVAQMTFLEDGRTLAGETPAEVATKLDGMGLAALGANCTHGPQGLLEILTELSKHTTLPLAAQPNAGSPTFVDGRFQYATDPAYLARYAARYVQAGAALVGGCCGTTPAHLAAVVERVRGKVPAEREATVLPSAASIYSQVPFDQDTSFLMIGERANTNGSKAFRDALLADDIEGCVTIGQSQLQEGAHLVDLCVDYVGRDGVEDMSRIAAAFATDVAAPVVLDSTEPEVMEAGLERLGGRSILNSANLEDGEAEGSRLDKVFKLAARHGAAVICLLIDEKGQARTLEWKLEIAHRIHDLAVERYGLDPSDLIFDALTFPLTTGGEDLRQDGIATLEAIKRIKSELPGVRTVLGVSNVSFGLNPAARQALNSVFLHEAVEAGLDAAIVHAGKIEPLTKIDPDQRQACLDLIYDRRSEGYDPLERILELFEDAEVEKTPVEPMEGLPVDERLARRIIDGDQNNIILDLDEALADGARPLDIINDFLLEGMRVVGDRFASGEMQLPFVLKSAETMKKAVAYLEPMMEKAETSRRGSVVLATVSGDVHDIGKNLVDIILSNNGYEVHNLGIKVGIGEMIQAYEEKKADAIGMSGLLVKSTLIMKDNLDELDRRGMGKVPVLLGGAALTRSYVEADLRSLYPGPLYYGKNAFAGLEAMGHIVAGDPSPAPAKKRERPAVEAVQGEVPRRSPNVASDNPIFEPPFLGSRVVRNVALDDVVPFLNLTALFRNQWQYRPESGEKDAEFKERLAPVLREQLALARTGGLLQPQVVYGYFAANGDGDELVL
ncbi:MAG TPA: homocysteine S-methyltransferase family protein, partial [Acidimicrobiia bacterium]|nr:homocysteine S-methyltransferase family protein [Acidimicrobiia bacterium]